MPSTQRSGCPINLTLEMLGDRWSLIVIRDVMFGNRRHYRDLLTHSEEGIASNILADRLKRLVAAGLLSRREDPSHKQKAIYSLTEPAIELVPLLGKVALLFAWSASKTFTHYGLRVGALVACLADEKERALTENAFSYSSRGTWSRRDASFSTSRLIAGMARSARWPVLRQRRSLRLGW